MKKEDYRIIHNYSQMTLNSLTAPCFHLSQGCQFNYYELDEEIQTQMQLDQSKQFICPVCHKQGQFRQDLIYYQNELKNDQNQFVVENSNQKVFRMYKLSFSYSMLSEQKDVLELQKYFNSKILKDNALSLKFIEDLNTQRNNEIFQIFRNSVMDKIPTLVGIINFKLILFYHLLKLKLELDIYDNTNNIKIDNYDCDKIKIKQVELINNFIYLIIQQENISQLYRGSLNQIWKQNEPKFYVSEMSGYTLLGESRLIQFPKYSIMIGNEASIIVEDQFNKDVEMNEDIKIPELNETSQMTQIFDSQIMFLDLQYVSQQGTGYYKELKIQEQKIQELRQNIFSISKNNNIDFSLIHLNSFCLLNSQSLNEHKAQVRYIQPGIDNISTKTFNIINHHSYLKVNIILTNKQKVGLFNCALVGLMFQNSQTIFPGVLVFNYQENKIEIELI